MVRVLQRVGDPQQPAERMPDQHHRATALGAGAGHDHVDVIEQRVEARRVTSWAATPTVAPVIHGIDGGAQRGKPRREVLIAAAVLAQSVHQDERPPVRLRLCLPAAKVKVKPIGRLECGDRLRHGLSRRKPR